MRRRLSTIVGLAAALMLCLVAGCAGTNELDLPNAGRTVAYESGVPNFDMEAVVTWREGRPGVDLYLGIPRASLSYVRIDSIYSGAYEAAIRVGDEDGAVMQREIIMSDSLQTLSYDETREYEPVMDSTRIILDPGQYVIEVELNDQQSELSALRRLRVTVPSRPDELQLSGIRLQRQEGAAPMSPALALYLQAGFDTLRAVTEVHGAPERPIEVAMQLVRFRTDTSLAKAPTVFTPFRGSIEYRGVDYESADTLQTSRRTIEDPGDVVIEFVMPSLEKGMYQVAVAAQEAGSSGHVEQQRSFAVRSRDFPRIVDLNAMIRALSYIADRDEMERLRSAETPEEKRRRFDAFWGRLIPERQKATNLLEKYFERVQEANMLFSGYKEGWKTDQGMVYIVMGAPIEVELRPETITWYYSYDQDVRNRFVFRRVRHDRDVLPHTVLVRQPHYERTWNRAIERWREGEVL